MGGVENRAAIAARFEQALTEFDLRVVELDAAGFAPYEDTAVKMPCSLPDVPEDKERPDVRHAMQTPDFIALGLLNRTDEMVGAQWAEAIPANGLYDMDFQIGSFATAMCGIERLGGMMFSREFVRSELRGNGLETGLRSLMHQAIAEAYPWSTLLLSAIARDNAASMASARAAGNEPSYVYSCKSGRTNFQYWFGVIKSSGQWSERTARKLPVVLV